MTDTLVLTSFFVMCPFHFGTYKLHSRKSAAQVGFASFPLHWQEGSFGQQGMPFSVERAVAFRKRDSSVKRDISFLKGSFLKQIFIDFNGVKSSVSQKCFGADQRMFLKKSFSTGMRALESARLLFSSGESDFFPTTISGWASRKSLLKKLISLTIPSPFVRMPNLKA